MIVSALADHKVPSELRWALGFQRGPLLYAAPDTLVSVCGNQICLQEQSNGSQVRHATWRTNWSEAHTRTCSFALQRLLNGAARGIECFHVNAAEGLIAYAEKVKSAANLLRYLHRWSFPSIWTYIRGRDNILIVQGLTPQLHIHRSIDLRQLQTISWTTQAGFAALALSGDGKWLAAVEQEQHCRLAVWDLQEVCICIKALQVLLCLPLQCQLMAPTQLLIALEVMWLTWLSMCLSF